MSTDAAETKKAVTAGGDANSAVSHVAPTEQQASRPGTPKRFAVGQTVCNEKNEKGKLCNGHLKQLNTQHESSVFLRGDDVLHKCQSCGALYMGPPMGHVRDPSRQSRFIERELAAILQAAGGTLPAYDYPVPEWRGPAPVRKAKTSAPETASETPEQKKARLLAEHQAKLAAKGAADSTTAQAEAASPKVRGSSAEADRHRPAAEAQAETGQASAAPLSPAAATASPAAGAETPADLATAASTELTPGAPPGEPVKEAPPEATAKPAAAAKGKKAGSHTGFHVPEELRQGPPDESPADKIARLKRIVEEAKRAAGKL